MNMTIFLLLVIAICELVRIYYSYRNTSKPMHFKNRLAASRQMLWDLEFKIFKTKEMREGIRTEYDAAKSRLFTTNQQLEGVNKEGFAGTEEDKKKAEDQKVVLERDIPRLEAAMAQLDAEIDGVRPSEQAPQGIPGAQNQIDQLRELHLMIEDYIAKL